jgi:hypothetical protein
VEHSTSPTVTLTSPSGLVASHSLHVQLLALIPLITSALIMGVTATYVWKLWHQEDKYYVEEDYSDEEYEDLEAKAIDPITIPRTDSHMHAALRERQLGTPESLIAAREEARAAPLWSGISRPLAARTMPLNVPDQAWTYVQTQKPGDSQVTGSVQVPGPPAFPPLRSRFSAGGETATNVPATDDAATYRSTPDASIHPNPGSARPLQAPIQEAVHRASSEAAKDFDDFYAAKSIGRLSQIDWKDDGSSLQGSEFTKCGGSEFGRSSYTNHYEDY